MRHFIPVTSLDTEELVDVFVHTVYKLHGAPDTIISDRGTAFVSDFWCCLNQHLKVALSPSSAWHPEIDGQTEIVNAAMNKYLHAYVSFTQDDWKWDDNWDGPWPVLAAYQGAVVMDVIWEINDNCSL